MGNSTNQNRLHKAVFDTGKSLTREIFVDKRFSTGARHPVKLIFDSFLYISIQ